MLVIVKKKTERRVAYPTLRQQNTQGLIFTYKKIADINLPWHVKKEALT